MIWSVPGSKCEGKDARVSSTICLSSLRTQDQGQLVQTDRSLPGAQDLFFFSSAIFSNILHGWLELEDQSFKNQVHPNPEGAEVNCPEERGGCGRPFSDLIDLHKHYWTTHKKGVECSLCGMLVKSRAYMSGIFPFLCRPISRPLLLSITGHMTGHSDAKALPCSFCPKSFKTKIQLDIHESRHTGQGKYECSICGKRFPQKGEVKNHEQQHGDERGYTCDHCGKSFARDAYLRIHMKVHAKRGEVPPKPARRCKNKIFCPHPIYIYLPLAGNLLALRKYLL